MTVGLELFGHKIWPRETKTNNVNTDSIRVDDVRTETRQERAVRWMNLDKDSIHLPNDLLNVFREVGTLMFREEIRSREGRL